MAGTEGALDQARAMSFLERVMVDSAAAFSGLSTSIGARLGFNRLWPAPGL
ncbi:hypothetical protein [Streptomyces sp. NPDC005077]|uniref:hypothetical protein n=1 Tax=Streptomyces sp. NPDC005077 TaxID=3154292 RepID=UPI0033A61FE4